MSLHQKRIDTIIDRFVERDLNELCNCNIKCVFNKTSRHNISNAIKTRTHNLMNNRISEPYTNNFTKCENTIIYKIVTNVLLQLSLIQTYRPTIV